MAMRGYISPISGHCRIAVPQEDCSGGSITSSILAKHILEFHLPRFQTLQITLHTNTQSTHYDFKNHYEHFKAT